MFDSNTLGGMSAQYGELPRLTPDDDGSGDGLLPPGAYLMRVLYVAPNFGKQYVAAAIDVAAGLYKDFFQGVPPSLDWRHTAYLSFKPGGLALTKRFLKAMTAASELDAFEAWNRNVRELEGRLVFLAVSHRETVDNFGESELLYEYAPAMPEALRSGRYSIRGLQHADKTREPAMPGEPVDVDALLAEAKGGKPAETDASGVDVNPLWGDADGR